jgi:ABC-type transport system involved in multi-copper enzyme maturation permease subunit
MSETTDNLLARLESGLQRHLHFNPCVLGHELRMRMRGGRLFRAYLFFTLLSMAPVLIGFALMAADRGSSSAPAAPEARGEVLFQVLLYTQLALILFILPAHAAGSLALEREKRTLEMLRATLLTPTDVVSGKLLVVVAFAATLLLTSLPIATWCVMLGGVEPVQVLTGYAYLFAVSLGIVALGTLVSCWVQRSVAAISTTYGLVLLSVISLPAAAGVTSALVEELAGSRADTLLVLLVGLFGLAVLIVEVGAAAWVLSFWLSGRRRRGRPRAWSTGVVAVLSVLWMVVWVSPGVALGVKQGIIGPVAMGLAGNPFGGLVMVTYPESISEVATSMTTTYTPAPPGTGASPARAARVVRPWDVLGKHPWSVGVERKLIALVAACTHVLFAALFWVLAIQAYRRRET